MLISKLWGLLNKEFNRRKINFVKVLSVEPLYLFLYNLFVNIISYGFLLNISTHYLFGYEFGVPYIVAWGIAFYFISNELPSIILRCKS